MLTKSDLSYLNGLLNADDVKGKKSLRKFIWLNTVQPKFNEGDTIRFTEKASYVYGNKVVNFIGTVEKVFKWYDGSKDGEKKICYGIRFTIEVDGEIESNLYANTEECYCSATDETNLVNHVSKKDKYQQSLNI